MRIVGCKSGLYFAKRLAKAMNTKLAKSKEFMFANTELKTMLYESLKNQDVLVVQCFENKVTGMSVNDNFIALLTALDVIKREKPKSISLLLLPFPYARQDRAIYREGITAKILSEIMESFGIKKIYTLDIHSMKIFKFFKKAKIINLYDSKAFIKHFKKAHPKPAKNLVLVSPDQEGSKRCSDAEKYIKAKQAYLQKSRDYKKVNVVIRSVLHGNVKGKNCLIIDDIVDTGGTILRAVETLKKHGAKDVFVYCSFASLNSKAVERIAKLFKKKLLKEFFTTDAVLHSEKFKKKHRWYTDVGVAKLFANNL